MFYLVKSQRISKVITIYSEGGLNILTNIMAIQPIVVKIFQSVLKTV